MNHPVKSQLNMLKAGALPAAETDALLAHIANCDECALAYADSFEEGFVLPPASLTEDILARIALEMPRIIPDPRREYILYCLRVGAAVCASLILVFSGVFKGLPTRAAQPQPNNIYQYTEQLGTGLSEFFEQFNQLEVVNNANKTE